MKEDGENVLILSSPQVSLRQSPWDWGIVSSASAMK